MMRISDEERRRIVSTIANYIVPPAELSLFGSRADDSAKGGDIDLLLVVGDETARESFQFDKAEILGKIKDAIGEQKIDLLVTTEVAIKTSAFLQSLLPSAQCLMRWD